MNPSPISQNPLHAMNSLKNLLLLSEEATKGFQTQQKSLSRQTFLAKQPITQFPLFSVPPKTKGWGEGTNNS